MLWFYLDESGEHDRATGALTRLTVAGGMATCEAWRAFDRAWDAMLDEFGLAEFHMVDFEAWAGPFNFLLADGETRDQDKHNRLLNAALDIIIEHVDHIVGYVAEPEAGKPPAIKNAYEANLAKAVKEAAIGDEPVTMVFAKHRDIKAAKIGAYFDLWDDGDGRLVFGGVGEPKRLLPLQAADILAYELSRWGRREGPAQERYPMRRLKEAFRDKLIVKDARFLLTVIP